MNDQFDEGEEDRLEERAPVERDEMGRFRGSGNLRGRPRKQPPLFEMDPRLPASRRKSVFNVADRMVKVKIGGKEEEQSIFEACVLQVGVAGATGDRIAARQMIDLAMSVSDTHLERRLVTAQVVRENDQLREENERLRAVHEKRTGTVFLNREETQARWPGLLQDRSIDDQILDQALEQQAREQDVLHREKDGQDGRATT